MRRYSGLQDSYLILISEKVISLTCEITLEDSGLL